MKKSIIIVIVLVVIGLAVWAFGGMKKSSTPPSSTSSTTPSISVPVTESNKVTDKLTEYKNEELGFVIKYPSVWELGTADSGVSFIMPLEKKDTNTVGKLDAKIVVNSGKCAFPPVTTIKERSSLKSGELNFNMISMSNAVQGSNYFDRMYSLQKGNICYILSFSSVTISPAKKNITGSAATQVTNNNKAIVDAGDQAFIEMVKSFAFIVSPAGKDETQVVPIKR